MALLMHVTTGLKLRAEDISVLLDERLDGTSVASVHSAVRSPEARAYLHAHPDWAEHSYRVLVQSERVGIRWSCLGHVDYPLPWYGLSTRPAVFSYRGDPIWKTHAFLGVVGSRTPSTDALLWMQRELSAFLRARPVGVVSGGARGVDQWSHRLCADAGRPTLCILPSGLLNPYPPASESLWERLIARGGCLLSTCALSEPMRKRFFEVRNRWIAGLGRGVLIVEANRRSGTMLTVKAARDESREVCTLPVSPMASQGLANLDLLVEGATLIRDHRDLATFWDRVSSPGALQSAQRDRQEEGIHQP